MIVSMADSINSILQSIMFILIPNYCIDVKFRKNNKQLIFYIFLLWGIIQLTTIIMGNSSLGAILLHIVMLISGAIVFKKDSLGAAIAFSIVQLCVVTNVIIFSNLFLNYIQYRLPAEYIELGIVLFMYIPHYIMTFILLTNKEKIRKIYISIRAKGLSIISLIIITIVADFIISFNRIVNEIDGPIFKEIIFVLLSVFIIGLTIYFANIEKKAKEIAVLNDALEEKVNELKKVKHDYGAQISYLYGLHLMEKHDRLGELLKDIINGHNSIISEVKITNDDDSIITMVVNGINHKGINVIIDEQASLYDTNIAEMELQRVISNILRNSVTAMNEKGIITIKTYDSFNNIRLCFNKLLKFD